ncbi:competence type IV pilus ATPase ComGA [Priestia koreensis]|uniref:Competence protein ComG n=1 Tax=Priestia koreensis TaxID=284581 RepID=A0A0M0KYP5_9BACI|nr:competence type IV pilus ATPase ComGA [Priestia koreensis]KOO43934.1 competence protein ComG [Priestia koreensis]
MQEIEQLAEHLITDAYQHRVSDIHILPREQDAIVQFRVGYDLVFKESMSKRICERLITHFKFLGGMDIGEKRRPQNGALKISIQEDYINLRLSTLPTAYEESLVIRVLPSNHLTPLQKLSLFPNTVTKLIALLKYSHGLLIFTGPTGSGKTTTLYTLLEESKNMFNRNIITLEDPIERRSEGVMQVQVNEKAGITYTTGLKAILRHDPDIIMVGEIRDAETAQIAVRAALTGHLVLTTMHTRDSKGAIYRLLEFGVPYQEIEQTLVGVVAQRLLEIYCPICGEPCHPVCKRSRKNRQASIYEILTGKNLMSVLHEVNGEESSYNYKTLKDAIVKGIALGYVHDSNLSRWVRND